MAFCVKCGKALQNWQEERKYDMCLNCYNKSKRAIYKNYWKGDSKGFKSHERRQMNKLLFELKTWKLAGYRMIPADEINMLIRRYAGTKSWNLLPKENYFRYWYKILESEGYIRNEGLGWALTNKLKDFIAK
jgi:hypothetical protein